MAVKGADPGFLKGVHFEENMANAECGLGGRDPGQGVRVQSPPEAGSFSAFERPKEGQMCSIFVVGGFVRHRHPSGLNSSIDTSSSCEQSYG